MGLIVGLLLPGRRLGRLGASGLLGPLLSVVAILLVVFILLGFATWFAFLCSLFVKLLKFTICTPLIEWK